MGLYSKTKKVYRLSVNYWEINRKSGDWIDGQVHFLLSNQEVTNHSSTAAELRTKSTQRTLQFPSSCLHFQGEKKNPTKRQYPLDNAVLIGLQRFHWTHNSETVCFFFLLLTRSVFYFKLILMAAPSISIWTLSLQHFWPLTFSFISSPM